MDPLMAKSASLIETLPAAGLRHPSVFSVAEDDAPPATPSAEAKGPPPAMHDILTALDEQRQAQMAKIARLKNLIEEARALIDSLDV